MKTSQRVACFCMFLVSYVGAPPPVMRKTETTSQPEDDEFASYNLSYERYIQEVIDALRSDPSFEATLQDAKLEDIRTGKIAEGLDLVSTDVRSKLDYIKHSEIERIRDKLEDASRAHVDLSDPSFRKEDLQKLLQKFAKDMEELDRRREAALKKKQEIAQEKEYRKLSQMSPEERRAAFEKSMKNRKQKHDETRDLKHPGSKDQLEQVWENVDEMPKEAFDLKTFFVLHDVNSDGYWDENEVEALFDKELSRFYNDSDPYQLAQKDMERMKMRQHVFKEIDKNHDSLISYEEFMAETKTSDFDTNEKWQPANQKPELTEEQLRVYEEAWKREMAMEASTVPAFSVEPQPAAVPQRPGAAANPPVVDEKARVGEAMPASGPNPGQPAQNPSQVPKNFVNVHPPAIDRPNTAASRLVKDASSNVRPPGNAQPNSASQPVQQNLNQVVDDTVNVHPPGMNDRRIPPASSVPGH